MRLKLRWKLLGLLLVGSYTPLALAIEAVSPESTCERFYFPAEKKQCQVRIQKLKPDSYLAAVCELQFDDAAFYACLEFAGLANFNPIRISACHDVQLSDEHRLECVRKIAEHSQKSPGQTPVQSPRIPASATKAKNKK